MASSTPNISVLTLMSHRVKAVRRRPVRERRRPVRERRVQVK